MYIRNNIIYLSFSSNNRRIRKSTGLIANQENILYVKQNLKNLKEKILFKDKQNSNYSLFIYAQDFLLSQNMLNKDSTKKIVSNLFKNHIFPFIKHSKIKHINRNYCKNFLIYLNSKNICFKTKTHIYTHFKSLILSIIDDELIDNFSLPKLKNNNIELNKIKALPLNKVKEILDKSPHFYRQVFALCIFTGIRNGELIALKWSDVCFKSETLIISKNIVFGKLSSTKNKKTRVIHLLKPALNALKTLYEKYKFHDEWIFVTKYKKAYTRADCFSKKWNNILKSIGIYNFTFYQTRHIYATLLLNKVPNSLEFISNQLGHSKITTTLKYYVSYLEDKEKITKIKKYFEKI